MHPSVLQHFSIRQTVGHMLEFNSAYKHPKVYMFLSSNSLPNEKPVGDMNIENVVNRLVISHYKWHMLSAASLIVSIQVHVHTHRTDSNSQTVLEFLS